MSMVQFFTYLLHIQITVDPGNMQMSIIWITDKIRNIPKLAEPMLGNFVVSRSDLCSYYGRLLVLLYRETFIPRFQSYWVGLAN